MLYEEKPTLEDLPTHAQLLRASIGAVAASIVLTIAVILPAEYGIDPTGAGKVLGLTGMGEIRIQLQEEVEQDEDHSQVPGFFETFASEAFGLLISPVHAQESGAWTDDVKFTL